MGDLKICQCKQCVFRQQIDDEGRAMIAENERLESEAVYSAAGFDAAREEIARLKAENETLRKDAERYRWLRHADWWSSPVCVIRNPKKQAKPGTDCPTRERLDSAIDAAMGQGEQS